MYIELENLPVTLVFKKSRQNLDLLSQYYEGVFIKASHSKNIAIPIHEEQVILLIQSSSLIGLTKLSYLAASMHHENKQNKL